MLWLCVEPERIWKTRRIMEAMAAGWPGSRIVEGAPPDDGNPFLVWGQKWLAARLIPQALRTGRPFWQLDNGYIYPAQHPRGYMPAGYYRLSYRGLSAITLRNAPPDRLGRLGVNLSPWRTIGRHILFALPGLGYGRSVGLDMPGWVERTRQELAVKAGWRPVIERPKDSATSIGHDLADCWAVVTHSSNAAVDAVLGGIPVIVAPSNPAAPVGNLSLDDLADPKMPAREAWLASLVCQQYMLNEMRDGTAYRLMTMIANQVDAKEISHA